MHFVFVPKLLDQSLLCQHTQHMCIYRYTHARRHRYTYFVHRLVCSYPRPRYDTFKYETHNCEARANANLKKSFAKLKFFFYFISFFVLLLFGFLFLSPPSRLRLLLLLLLTNVVVVVAVALLLLLLLLLLERGINLFS